MSALDRLPPDSGAAALANRARMLRASVSAARSADPVGAAVARALRRTALGRTSADERTWLARVAERRRAVGALSAADLAGPESQPGPESQYLADWSLAWSLPAQWGGLLHCLVRELKPRSCLELGAGFGVSAAYIASALELNGGGRLVSFDSENRVIRVAEAGLEELSLAHRARVVPGAIARTLPGELPGASPVDWALIDAEHTEDAVLADFAAVLPGLGGGAVVLLDDIHLSPGMTRAWERVAAHDRVGLALDLHRLGLLSIKPE
jgi:predicted O-methyltransferase YrrM